MSEQRLGRALREVEAPEAGLARARALEAALGARAERPANPWPARLRPLALMVCAAAAVVLALTPPGDAVGKWLHRIVSSRPAPAPVAARGLIPGTGRLLVAAGGHAWIVHPDGRRTALGRWSRVAWSPHGLFIAAWRGRTLAALDPHGRVRWSIRAPGSVRAAAWSPQGFHVVYLAGRELRVVSGRGLGDSALRRAPRPGALERAPAGRVMAIAPAFRPGTARTLAFVTAARHAEVIDVYTGALLWRSRARVAASARALAWTGDGTRLVALSRSKLQRWSADGRALKALRLPAGRTGVALAAAPRGRRVAISQVDEARRESEVVLVGARTTRVFEGHGRLTSLTWSPDGRWLLATWPSSNMWLFLEPGHPSSVGVAALADITRRFGEPAPALGGWCCSAP